MLNTAQVNNVPLNCVQYRNISLKSLDPSSKPTVKLRRFLKPQSCVIAVLCVTHVLWGVHTSGILDPRVTSVITMCFLSSLFHVCYSFVSTGLVLTEVSLTSAARGTFFHFIIYIIIDLLLNYHPNHLLFFFLLLQSKFRLHSLL